MINENKSSYYPEIYPYKKGVYSPYNKLCGIQEKPTAQTAHLVFADTKANAEKTKRAVFCQRSERNKRRN